MSDGRLSVSPWIERFAPLIPQGGVVLDVAAGGGRHTRYLAARGHHVVAVDRETSGLVGAAHAPGVEVVRADLEGAAWPFQGRRFHGIVVTNYLHRPLLPTLLRALTDGGALLYETYAVGQERFGRPRDPAFLLRPGELLQVVEGSLHVVAYEDLELPRPARVQRIAAVRSPSFTRS